MSHYYVISTRAIRGTGTKARFIPEPGPTSFLRVPAGEVYQPKHIVKNRTDWITAVRDLADGQADSRVSQSGDILVFIHGYNNSPEIIAERQRYLMEDLAGEGFKGVVISFDWPSADSTLNYLEDRSDAAVVATRLVTDGIQMLAACQETGCATNIHLLGHSTGAYLIMEAFAEAEKVGALFKRDWRVDQVAFIGGDIAAASLGRESAWSNPLFDRCVRVTNYQNPFDHVLAVSNAKRLGASPCAGRVGIEPALAHGKVANVHCGEHFKSIDPKASRFRGTFAHSWHIGNRIWARDLALTLNRGIHRDSIPTRRKGPADILHLQDAPLPTYISDWALQHGITT